MKLYVKTLIGCIVVGLMLACLPCQAAGQPDTMGKDTVAVDREQTAPLSVPPLDHVDYPADRPSWIQEYAQPTELPEKGEIVIAVTSGPAATPEIATEMMEVMARGAVENFLQQRAEHMSEVIPANEMTVELDWIRNELITRQYAGTLSGDDSRRYESACLLRIDRADQRTLDQLIQNVQLQRRIAVTGIVAVLCLLSLLSGSILFGWLTARQQA